MNHSPQIRAALALGFKIEGDALTCSGRKGYLYGPTPGLPGEKSAVVINDDGTPLVLSCEHEALAIVERVYQRLLPLALIAAALGEGAKFPLPKPEEFQYVFVEDAHDPEVTTCDDANSILDSIRSRK